MIKHVDTQTSDTFKDEYGNLHYLKDELARGGQGVVYRTRDSDLAIKQPIDASGQPDQSADLGSRFQNIRLLPIPSRIRVSLPLAILQNKPGYVMRLLNGMKPFECFELDGTTKTRYREALAAKQLDLPKWLAEIPDQDVALLLHHYASTGATRRRLFALAQCASIVARLHAAGLVYGDISPKNAFVGVIPSREVWLIDADNLRFECSKGGSCVYSPGYGAPEVVRGADSVRPRSDCWAFAVLAFKILALSHPFIGKKVLQPESDADGWDADPSENGQPADLDEKAYAGIFPFVDDNNDDSNQGISGLPRELVATPMLRLLFQETFCEGKMQPHRRPAMEIWAMELIRSFDLSLECPECKMSYYPDHNGKCPYCDSPKPGFIRAETQRWNLLIPASSQEFELPHRLFHPFSLEHSDDTEYEADIDFSKKTIVPIRGTKAFPESLTFEFSEAET